MKQARAVIYARFSPRRLAELCESNELQLAACRTYCCERGYLVSGEFEDREASGDDEERPGLWGAVAAVGRGGVLVVHKQDRLARSVYLEEYVRKELDRKGSRIEIVEGSSNGESPQDVLIRQILAAVAEMEKKIIAARTSDSMRKHQANGRSMGGRPPFGKKFGPDADVTDTNGQQHRRRTLVDDPKDKPILDLILSYRKRGWNPNEIAAHLNKNSVPCRGKRWHRETIVRICERHEARPA